MVHNALGTQGSRLAWPKAELAGVERSCKRA
jgi:hypothetical protein